MSIRTTVTLDDDVMDRLKERSKAQSKPFRDMLNDMVRLGLLASESVPKRNFKIVPFNMGHRPELDYDCTEKLLEYAEGPEHL